LLGATLLAGCGDSAPRTSDGSSDPTSTGAAASSGKKTTANSTAPPKPIDPNAVDLRSLPQIEHAKFTILTANRLEGTSNDSASTIFAHYRTALEKLGWKLSEPLTKDQVTDESAAALLNKGDESIFLSIVPYVTPKDKGKAAQRQFNVDNLGTCDSSKLPRLPGSEPGYSNKISSVYFTDMKVSATAASVRNLLAANGWQQYNKPYASPPVMLDRIRDQFRKDGNSLRVLVSPAPGKENKSAVEYVIGAIGHQLPAPPDATDVEFDDALYLMICNVPRDIDPVAKYYHDAMTALGFEVGNYAVNESNTVIICKSTDRDAYVALRYEGVNTRVELSGNVPKDRKKAGEDVKKP
jgi:hypothetical protein